VKERAMKRPRTYRDRRWLDGYMQVAEQIGRPLAGGKRFPTIHREQARHLLWIYMARMRAGVLTAVEAGRADALLDAVGC